VVRGGGKKKREEKKRKEKKGGEGETKSRYSNLYSINALLFWRGERGGRGEGRGFKKKKGDEISSVVEHSPSGKGKKKKKKKKVKEGRERRPQELPVPPGSKPPDLLWEGERGERKSEGRKVREMELLCFSATHRQGKKKKKGRKKKKKRIRSENPLSPLLDGGGRGGGRMRKRGPGAFKRGKKKGGRKANYKEGKGGGRSVGQRSWVFAVGMEGEGGKGGEKKRNAEKGKKDELQVLVQRIASAEKEKKKKKGGREKRKGGERGRGGIRAACFYWREGGEKKERGKAKKKEGGGEAANFENITCHSSEVEREKGREG